MATLIDTLPSKIEKTESGQYHFIYAKEQDLNKLPVGSEYIVVYAPTTYSPKGCVIRYRVVGGEGITIGAELDMARALTADEIAHFKALVASQKG